MPTNPFTPSTLPRPTSPDPLLLFIQQAQLALYYREDRSSGGGRPGNQPAPD